MRLDPRSFRFGPFVLHLADHQLVLDGRDIVLRPKAFETLAHLVQHHGRAVPKTELLDAVWPETNVSEAVLTHCIAEVRMALGDSVRQPRYIKTVSKHGYRFIAPVEEAVETAPVSTALQPADSCFAPPPASIVVLPFSNISGDDDNEYFCDGLSEELINGLTKTGGLQVVAHSSSFSFKGRDVDAREIGRQLNVGAILEGSVRKTGTRLRVSAQLIDATRGYHVWCEQYDRDLRDVFALQEEISRAILAALRVESARDPSRLPLFKPLTANMDAYLLYLQGRSAWHHRFDGGLRQAMDLFGQAVAKDPGLALGYTGLADCLISAAIYGFGRPADLFPKALALTETALRLDADLAEAHASRAVIHLFWDWNWRAAEDELQHALALNPGNALIRLWYGHYLCIVGRLDESITEVKRAQALDPVSPVCGANVGWTLYLAHRPQAALDELQHVLSRWPRHPLALLYLGFAWLDVGCHDKALDCLTQAAAAAPGLPFSAEGIGMVHGLAGRRGLASAALEETEARARATYVLDSARAVVHLGLGDRERMMDCLEQAVEARDTLLPWVGLMPCFDPFRDDARFKSVMARVGLV